MLGRLAQYNLSNCILYLKCDVIRLVYELTLGKETKEKSERMKWREKKKRWKEEEEEEWKDRAKNKSGGNEKKKKKDKGGEWLEKLKKY